MSTEGGADDAKNRRALALASACFILSGAAALIYQVAWQRVLALTTGVSIHSVAAITAAFMAGLGIGSHLGGLWSERLSPRRAIRAFALVEIGIAIFASVSVAFYYDGLYRHFPGLYDHGAVLTFLTHFVSLIVPTTLMGMSLPLLVRGLVLSGAAAPRTIGFLYAANALGAAIGAFATPWLLLRFLGVDGAVLCGAALSAAAGIGAALLARGPEGDASAAPVSANPPASPLPEIAHEGAQPLGLWVALYALSGFLSLSLEIVWFRVLDVMAKGGAFTFGTLLGMFLVGLAAGSLVATGSAARIRRPLRVFLICQGLMVASTLLAHTLIVRLPFSGNALEWMVEYAASPAFRTIGTFTAAEFAYLYIGMPLVLFGPATFCMGFGFPVLQRAIQSDPESAGRKVGLLQAANIAGCTLGSLVTGLALLEALGSAGVFRLLGTIGLVVVTVGAFRLRAKSLTAIAVAIALLIAVFPDNRSLWLRLHGDPDPARSYFKEDAASVSAFTPREGAGSYNLWTNGRSISWIPFGSLHTVLGAVPALVHPAPRDVAIIGLGSGDTAWAAGLREETERITVFEIAISQPQLLDGMRRLEGMQRLDQFLDDPRVEVVMDDGRRRLGRDRARYDIIEADAMHPDRGMAGNLYSVEFYELVSRALKPGGVMCAWTPTPRSEASALKAFKHAISFPGLLVLSNDPIAIDVEAWMARLHTNRVRRYLGRVQFGPIEQALRAARLASPSDQPDDVNHDLDPRDEYRRPRR